MIIYNRLQSQIFLPGIKGEVAIVNLDYDKRDTDRCFCLFISNPSQAETGEDDIHSGPARRVGEPVRQDSVPGYLHERGGGLKDQPA